MFSLSDAVLRKTFLLGSLLFPLSGLAADTAKVSWPKADTALKTDAATEQQLDALLANMTIEQKVAQIVQPEIGYLSVAQMRKYGFGSYLNGGNTAPYGQKQADAKCAKAAKGFIKGKKVKPFAAVETKQNWDDGIRSALCYVPLNNWNGKGAA